MPQASAEDMLEKSAIRYLGWQTSVTEFTTCEKSVLKIDAGKVSKTMAKCEGPVFAVLRGQMFTVNAVDAESRIFNMTDEKGNSLSAYYPLVAEKPSTMKFDSIKPGQKVDVEYATIFGHDTVRVESVIAKKQ